MAVNLHRCANEWLKIGAHPCWRVQKALDEAGVAYEVVPGPLRRGKREDVERLSGQRLYPVVEFEDGSVYRRESAEMARTIREGRLFDAHGGGVGGGAPGNEPAMSEDAEKETRPPDLAEGTDPDLPQDPGIPGNKAEEEGTQWEPHAEGRPFPGSDDERAKAEAAEADGGLAPGSMPPDQTEPA